MGIEPTGAREIATARTVLKTAESTSPRALPWADCS
jgi:hypothetical protein